MIGQGLTAIAQTGPKLDIFQAAANLRLGAEYDTLIFDGGGRIRGCGTAVESMFGTSRSRLRGRRISEFIAGLSLGGNSPSYSARYFGYLCTDNEWRRFEAKDAAGQGFQVELKLSRVMTDGQEMFLLNLRRMDAHG